MELSKKIEELRKIKGISPNVISEFLGVDRTNYYRIEKRGDKMTVEQLQAIANALGVSLSELLELDVPVENEEKTRELEKRIEELEERIKDKQSIITLHDNHIRSYESDIDELLAGLGSDIINFFSAKKFERSVSFLYRLKDEHPYCTIERDAQTEKQVRGYLHFKSKESNFLLSFCESELFNFDSLYDEMESEEFIIQHKESISTIVSDLFENKWNEEMKEMERIENNTNAKPSEGKAR